MKQGAMSAPTMLAKPSHIFIADHKVGPGAAPFIIAEVAQAHDGSLGTAHAYIDAVADAGAHAVKFQTHIATAESTPGEPWRIRFSPQDDTRFAYWKRMEFGFEGWRGLRDHAVDRGLIFLSSPFSEQAVDLLSELGVPAWKVGSGEVSNTPLLDRMVSTGRPILLSSGMSSWSELGNTLSHLDSPVALLQCTSSYPCPPEQLGLNVIGEMRQRFGVPVGLSDHSASIYSGLGAVALGADLLEVHVVFDRRCFGPDTTSSLTVDELAELARGSAFLHRARMHPVDKDLVAQELEPMKRLFEKSVVLKKDALPGHVLEKDDLAFKKPGTGISAAHYERVLGRTLRRPVAADVPLTEEDLDYVVD